MLDTIRDLLDAQPELHATIHVSGLLATTYTDNPIIAADAVGVVITDQDGVRTLIPWGSVHHINIELMA